jgi:outer membrane protein
MKKLLKVALVAICMLFMGNFAKAQTKIGYIAFDQVIQLMPETKTIQTQIQAYSKQFSDKLQALQDETNTKIQAYQKGQATMTDALRIAAQGEITDLQKRTQDYSNTAQQSVDAKVQELIKPISDKVRVAVNAAAKEKGYTYVFNTTSPDLMIVAPEADDLMAAVKLKLAIK